MKLIVAAPRPVGSSMGRRAFVRMTAAAALAGALGLSARQAAAGSLTAAEKEALERGEVVRRPVDVDLEEGKYIGGVAYAVVNAPAAFVLGMMKDVGVYKRILPLTLEARATGRKGIDQLVYFKHGGDKGTAGYTARVRDADDEGVVKFWMDQSLDHEIDDLWGYTRIEALGPERSLATYAVLCDLGLILRVTFGEEIREYALDTPGHLKHAAEGDYRAATGR